MELLIENLTKTYPNGVRALNGVTLHIPRGLFGLLGPNGAGKSSLMRTIATLQEPDAGTIRFGDIDVLRDKEAMRRRLGYLPQEFGFYPTLSAEATLEHFAALKGLREPKARRETVQRLLHQVNLYDARRKNVGGYSGGMRQRLGIAVALLGDPQVIIVDEPTAGLDPTERHRFLNLLSEVGENVVVILSTHIVEDVRELCERMAIIARGQVVAQGSPEKVIGAVKGRMWKRVFDKSELADAQARYQVVSTRLVAGKPVLFVYSEAQPGDGFSPVEADLEDAYFFHTARVGSVPAEAVAA
ncbi:MAG TPA: ABC transporter ATP-binding protein [Armatimonadaceae bacterium]|jgi:ABC-type multidrug transport system ATPase subunit|nr:ABC transporter ATP-binding protein [Armatimonadaceae bacterium]